MAVRGIVSGGSTQSVEAGAEALRAGGNAVDAAVAAAFATSAGAAAITSLAGGGVLVFRDGETGAVEVCDFFSSAPGLGGRRGGRADREVPGLPPLDFHVIEVDFGSARQPFHIGRAAAAIPGAIPGLLAARERWGTLPLEVLLRPAIGFLRQGFDLSKFQSYCFQLLEPILRHSEVGRRCYFGPDGKPLPPGARFRNPALAETLERLSRDGDGRFYREVIVSAIAEEFGEERGGCITPEDLRSWTPEFRAPLLHDFGGARIATNPAPSVGGRFIVRTLELLEAARLADTRCGEPEYYRRLAAAFRALAELRLEHPDLLERPEASRLLEERLREILSAGGVTGNDGSARPPPAPGNTTHISVVDSRGNAAGVTLSHGEGNGHEIDGTGILMNNFLGEEDLFPHGFHRYTPGERLATMMAPTLVMGPGDALTVVGSGGSNRIRTALAQVIHFLLVEGDAPAAAVEKGRIHFEGGILSAETVSLAGGAGTLDPARSLAVETVLFDRPSLFFGGVHVARREPDGALLGAGDRRRDGQVRLVEDERP